MSTYSLHDGLQRVIELSCILKGKLAGQNAATYVSLMDRSTGRDYISEAAFWDSFRQSGPARETTATHALQDPVISRFPAPKASRYAQMARRVKRVSREYFLPPCFFRIAFAEPGMYSGMCPLVANFSLFSDDAKRSWSVRMAVSIELSKLNFLGQGDVRCLLAMCRGLRSKLKNEKLQSGHQNAFASLLTMHCVLTGGEVSVPDM